MLSIIIPTYNEERFLPRLLRSLKKQSFRDFEVIVADAISTDRTVQLARGWGARVIGGGLPSVGRNAGAKAALGDIFLFLDADVVLLEPNFLQNTINEFQTKGLDVATCLPFPLTAKRVDQLFYEAYNIYARAMKPIMPHAGGFCIFTRRHTHEKIGGFDERVLLAEDHDYVKRARRFGAFDFLQTSKIPVSTRRFERDGRLTTTCKYLLCELHLLTRGSIKSDLFRYRFGYTKLLNNRHARAKKV